MKWTTKNQTSKAWAQQKADEEWAKKMAQPNNYGLLIGGEGLSLASSIMGSSSIGKVRCVFHDAAGSMYASSYDGSIWKRMVNGEWAVVVGPLTINEFSSFVAPFYYGQSLLNPIKAEPEPEPKTCNRRKFTLEK